MRLLLSGILSVLLAPIVAAEPLVFINVNVVPMSSELVLRQRPKRLGHVLNADLLFLEGMNHVRVDVGALDPCFRELAAQVH